MVSSEAATVADYLSELPEDRRTEIERVRDLVNDALPEGYQEGMGYGMIVWSIPLERYPDTYNKQPLGYAALAAQKNSNSLYLYCAYASKESAARLKSAAAATGKKLDIGKSCIRFKRAEQLPLDAIRQEISSATPDEFIRIYEAGRASGVC